MVERGVSGCPGDRGRPLMVSLCFNLTGPQSAEILVKRYPGYVCEGVSA